MEIVEVGYSSTYFKVFLFKEIIKLVNPSVEFSEIEEDFNSHINSIIGTAWKKDKLTEYIKNEYEGNILVHLNDFLYSKSKGENFNYSNSIEVIIGFNRNKSYDYSVINESLVNYLE